MGSLEGVVGTRAGWIGEREVVEVRYRPGVVAFTDLLDEAVEHGCADRVWATTHDQFAAAEDLPALDWRVARFAGGLRPAKQADQLYYLERSPLRLLPLTPLQARRVNGALFRKEAPRAWLSPRQREALAAVEERLARDPDAFEGWTRPAGLDSLAEYAARLEARLGDGSR